MEKNEPLLISASHFWSNALNAFLFGHEPMTITLADVLMLTGLNITSPIAPYDLFIKPTHRLHTKEAGGWSSYISKHTKNGTVDDREHTTFLNMWLEKFIFHGSTLGPTNNHQYLAERLVGGGEIPLGKYLLGATYSLLHQVAAKLSAGEPIENTGGPWWFIQLWLNLYTHQGMGRSIRGNSFPSFNFVEGEEMSTRQWMSFGEAASAISWSPATTADTTQIFKSFYIGFTKDATIWFAYNGADEFELPSKFRFSDACTDGASIFKCIIAQGVLLVGFHQGRNKQ